MDEYPFDSFNNCAKGRPGKAVGRDGCEMGKFQRLQHYNISYLSFTKFRIRIFVF